MATITLIVGDPAYGKQRIYTTLRFTQTALAGGDAINIFLLEDAIFSAKKGQNPMGFPGFSDEKMPNCEEMIKTALKQGAIIKVCTVCAKERGMKKEELIDGVQIGSMPELVQWVVESDKVVSF